MSGQVQRDTDTQYDHQRETNASGSPEPIGGQFDVQHMQTAKQQSPTSMYSDQQGRRGLAEQLHGADGVLSDDRIRNTVIENHRRTTAAITATTNSVAAATAEFRRDAKENYPSLISTIKGNGERTDRLSANTKVIIDNTDTISRIGKKYSDQNHCHIQSGKLFQ